MNKFLPDFQAALKAQFKNFNEREISSTSNNGYPTGFTFQYDPCHYIFVEEEIPGLVVISQYIVENKDDFTSNIAHLTNANNHPPIPGMHQIKQYSVTENIFPNAYKVEIGTPKVKGTVIQTLDVKDLASLIQQNFLSTII